MESLESILNFIAIDARLACCGQPAPEQYALIARHGFETMVNLATEKSTGHLPDEADICRANGLDFTWLPVDWEAPRLDDYLAFQKWMDASRKRKALVHCALNWRASMFCALYRVIREGLAPGAAREAVLEVWQPEGAWAGLSDKVLAAHGLSPIRY
ncbi:MAG: protein tyrosine phosphatase family protein [Thermodesulfobacteriota bacterium]